MSTTGTETLLVTYTPTASEAGQTYAVAAFLMKSHMTYDFSTSIWTDSTAPISTSYQYDSITITGVPAPPSGNPLAGLTAALSNLVNAIKNWLCNTVGICW